MRELTVIAVMLFVVVYAQFHWFRALCIVIVLAALRDYPGLPDPIQIKGVSPWLVMLLGTVAGWLAWRAAQRPAWDVPPAVAAVVGVYLGVELLAILRVCLNIDDFRALAGAINPEFEQYTARAVLVDSVYVPLRYMFVAFLLFDGIRSKRDLLLAIVTILACVTLYALVVNRQIPPSLLLEQGVDMRRFFWKWTHRHPNDLSRELGASLWILFAITQIAWFGRPARLAAAAVMPLLLLALAHSHSRGGYLGFVASGLVLAAAARWWRIVPALGAVGLATLLFAPNVVGRILTGYDETTGHYDVGEVTAGRNLIWSAALSGIAESPLIGHGAYGYIMSGAVQRSILLGGGEIHPHNAYLQTLLDHGILLGGGRLAPLVAVLVAGVQLVRTRNSAILRLAGVAGLMFATGSLAMGLTGQQYGLTENLFLFWCVGALTARAAVLPDTVWAPARRVSARAAPQGVGDAPGPARGGGGGGVPSEAWKPAPQGWNVRAGGG